MRKITIITFLLLSFVSLFAQRAMENLDRGLVAAKIANGVYVNWRITGQEWNGVSYNIYRDGTKINVSPITGASNFIDASGTLSSKYKVTAIVDDVEQTPSKEVDVLPQAQINITLEEIPKIAGVPDSYYDLYRINDITAADLDGDGEYELIVKRVNEGYDSSNPFENKYYTLFDAYKLDGTFLWRIDVGPNLFHNVEITVIAYDFDSDGKAEVVMRTSEGTVDGLGNVIGDLGNAAGEAIPDGKTNYRDKLQNNGQWFEYEGPEYLSLFDGETGEMLDRIDHIARQPVSQWGAAGTQAGGLAHRATKFFYGAPYLDGKKPSLFISRGIYHRIKMAAYDIVNKEFQPRWTWDSASETGTYAGQGNHNYSIADVDNDGRDEIVYGSMTIDDDGTGLYTTGLGHGDALHVGDFDPFRKGLEVFACLENSPYYGTTFRTAEDGTILLQYIAGRDTGRSMAANVSNDYKGAELWPSQNGVFSASQREEISLPGGYSTNFRIFWDGDLLEELVDHNWNGTTRKGEGVVQKLIGNSWQNVLTTTGYFSCNDTKGTPCLQADLFGDWREELIFRSDDDKSIAIFFTTDYTEHRIYTLMHDMQYRQAIAWQMCGYNQPPHTSYFLGDKEGITIPPPPVMDNQRLVFNAASTTWTNGSANWTKDGVPVSYSDGSDVLFDVSGHVDNIQLTGTVSPKSMTVNSPGDYSIDMTNGKLSGVMKMVKQGNGTFQFNGNHDYSGSTEIWDGYVVFDGVLENTGVWINRFGEFSVTGTIVNNISMNYASVLYPGGKENIDSLKITDGDLELKENSIVEFDLKASNFESDVIALTNGSLSVEEGAVFRIIQLTGEIPAGDYTLMDVATVQGDIQEIEIEGLSTRITSLSHVNGKIILTVEDTRSAETIVWKGALEGAVWNQADVENFTLNGTDTYFVAGDNVIFDDNSDVKTVYLSGVVSPASVSVNTEGTYTFDGSGRIGGTASLAKTGSGKLILKGTNDYSGATVVNQGILAIESMPYLINNGSVGKNSDDPDLFIINGGTLTGATSSSIVSNKAVKIGSSGGVFDTNVDFDWDALITGGTLTKKGTKALSIFKNNTNDTLKIINGTVRLRAEEAYPAKNVVFESGTLSCYDNSGTYSSANWNIIVGEGKSGTINLDSRCDYTGKLTGGGTLTVMSPFVRSYLNGNWSAFTGTVIATTDSDGGDLSFNNNQGLPNAELNVAGALNVFNNAGTSFLLGALSGNSDGKLTGNHEWVIGAKNTSTIYNGRITAGSITKVGTGTLTLTNTSTYSGTTTINGGRLLLKNSSTTGSALGTGTIAVDNGAYLGGTGIVNGNVIVRNGGYVEPGDHTSSSWSSRIGTLTFEKNLTVLAGGTLTLSVRNLGNNPSDLIVVKGTFAIAGNVEVEIVNGNSEFVIGDKLKLFDLSAATISGSFANITLPPVAEGAEWDTSKLLTDGTVEVVSKSSALLDVNKTNLSVSPNPADTYVIVNLLADESFEIQIVNIEGRIVHTSRCNNGDKIDVSALPKGFYILKTNDRVPTSFKLIKQ